MPDSMVTITGADDLIARLKALPAELAKHALGRAIKAKAKVIADEIQARCPIDTSSHTAGSDALPRGALKASITVMGPSLNKEDGALHALAGAPKSTGYVARWVEHGHMLKRGLRPTTKAGRAADKRQVIMQVPAHPFMLPAANAKMDAANDAFAQSFSDSVIEAYVNGKVDSID